MSKLLDPSIVLDVYELAKQGRTDKEIANALEVPYSRLIAWKRTRPEIVTALERGRIAYDPTTTVTEKINNPKQIAFLMSYANLGTVSGASQSTGVSMMTHHRWVTKDAKYKEAFEAAKEAYADLLHRASHKRAVVGLRQYKFHQGRRTMVPCDPKHEDAEERIDEETGKRYYVRHYYEVVYSDRLLLAMLEAHIEKYRARKSNETNVNVGTTVVLQDVVEHMEKERATRTVDAVSVQNTVDAYIEQHGLEERDDADGPEA